MAGARRAYALIGHSSEAERDFTVPSGVTIIYKRKAGQVTDARADIKQLLCEKTDLFSDPETHAAEIVNRLGSVAVYPAESEAPDIKMKFFTGWLKDRILMFLPHSGVIPLGGAAARLGCREAKKKMITMEPSAPPDFLVPDMYDLSLIPRRADVEKVLAQLPPSTTMQGLLNAPSTHPFKQVIGVSLETVVNTLGPGVYYVVSCRGTKGQRPYTVHNSGNRRGSYHYTLRNNIAGATLLSTRFPGTARNINLLKRAIGEAETRRKSAIRGSRFARGGGTRRR
jgi:hypothetical protein